MVRCICNSAFRKVLLSFYLLMYFQSKSILWVCWLCTSTMEDLKLVALHNIIINLFIKEFHEEHFVNLSHTDFSIENGVSSAENSLFNST